VILPIVEGHAEVEAVPVLLRRMLERIGPAHVQVARPFRVKRYLLVRAGELERAIQQGLRDRGDVSCLLVLLDADDDDPHVLEKELWHRCTMVTELPSAVVLACRELEAWFLGSKESLRGVRGIRPAATAPPDPEEIRGAKERLSRNMETSGYLEVDDQPAFAGRMDLDLARQRCASFRRLWTALEHLLRESGYL
jgi:Domain of unknown function (DUF4276)